MSLLLTEHNTFDLCVNAISVYFAGGGGRFSTVFFIHATDILQSLSNSVPLFPFVYIIL